MGKTHTDSRRGGMWLLLGLLLAVLLPSCQGDSGFNFGPGNTTTTTGGTSGSTTAPVVTFTAPQNGATNVPTNSKLVVTFSETMNTSTLNTSTFTLALGGKSIGGTVTASGASALFTPSASLAANSVFTATITTGAQDPAGNALATNFVWTFTTGAAPDTTAPTVIRTAPVSGATAVPLNQSVVAVFSEAMNPLTITSSTFTLAAGASVVSGSVGYAGNSATFTPAAPLLASTTYTAIVTTGATDLAGNALASNFVWSFNTGTTTDTTAPTVTSTNPTPGETAVPLNQSVVAVFSEAMNPLTITPASFSLVTGSSTVAGSVGFAGNSATFTPAAALLPNTTYTATITTAATDLAGNALAANFVWSFTTGTAPDTTAPTVTSTEPTPGETGVSLNHTVAAVFSEAMSPFTITPTTFTLALGATPVAGSVGYAGTTATFTPTAPLLPSTTYTATVTTGATDLAGNALAANFVWTFTTGVAADTTPPTVISTDPANGATGVPLNHTVAATFSEAMNPLTLTTATFTLSNGGSAVVGTVGYALDTATFTPTAPLLPSTTYTATVTTGATDLEGNALATNFVWTFTTGTAPDTTPPTVTSTNPADGVTGVCIQDSINATFSKAMNPTTITTLTFTVTGPGGTPVAGTVTYDATSNIATFTPTASLAINTKFTATISGGANGVKDLSGNALASDKTFSFTTGTQACSQPVSLGTAALFGCFGGGAGMTNQGTLTVVNGDIGTTGASTTVTGFHDTAGNIYTETTLNKGQVNGTIYTAPPAPGGTGTEGNAATFAIAQQGAADALKAFNSLSPASLPGGTDPGAGQLGGLTLAPGIYKAAGGSFLLTGSDLTLDAQGDTNAVWVFQMASSLTVGAPAAPRSIILINGAQAKNVFWQVGSAATINGAGGGTMVGTIIASAGVTFSTAGNVTVTTLNGRAIGLNASVTLVNTVINVPGP